MLLRKWIEAEGRSPGPRSAEVLVTLRRLASLWEEAASDRAGARPSNELAQRTADRRLLRALQLMDTRLSTAWTVSALALEAGMSRAAFARAFAAAFGVAPLEHLSAQRFEHARARLIASDECLAAIAASIGYQSEFAFSRAFKRRYGVAPGFYRRRGRGLSRRATAPNLRLAA